MRSLPAPLIRFFVLALISACAEQAADIGPSVRYFERKVVPILEEKCAQACHGIPHDTFETFMSQPGNGVTFSFPFDPITGKIPKDSVSIDHAYQVTRGKSRFQKGKSHRIEYGEEPRFSHLLRVPLVEDFGGLPHRGLDVFLSTSDPDYKALQLWIAVEVAAHPEPHAALSPEATYFKDKVQPLMIRNGCFLTSCHGSDVFNDLKLVPPLPVLDPGAGPESGFSTKMTLKNRETTIGKVSRLVNLGGELELSRLIVKNLPIAEGGIHQRGGNNQFFDSYDDRDVQTLLEWMRMERTAVAKKLTSEGQPIAERDLGRLRAIAFIRGPRHAPRQFWDVDPFWPGSDIFLLRPKTSEALVDTTAKPINLTASSHPNGAVEIQSLDVRYDGKAIVYSARSKADEGFRIFELLLEPDLSGATDIRQVTFGDHRLGDGTLVHHIDPIYQPGPGDEHGHALDNVAVAYASNEAGAYAASESWGLLGEADSGAASVIVDAQRIEAPGTFDGRRLFIVDGPHKGQWRRISRHAAAKPRGHGSHLILDRPLSAAPDRRTVYVIEKLSARYLPSYDIWRVVLGEGEAKANYERTMRRMTFTAAQERRPSMRTTGETMFTTVRNMGYQGDRPIYNGAIFRTQAGGFDYHIQGGNRSRYPLYADSRELPNGLEVRVVLDPRNAWSSGALIIADHGLGVNVEPDNPLDDIPFTASLESELETELSSPPRFLPAQLPILPEVGAKAVTHTGLSPGGSFRDPFPLPDGRILTTHSPAPLDHLDASADPDWDVYMLDFVGPMRLEDGRRTGPIKLTRIAAASTTGAAEFNARPIIVRLKENAHPHQKFTAYSQAQGPADDLGVKRMPEDTAAEIECYDYHLLQSFLTNFAPVGARDFHTATGNPTGAETHPDLQFKYVRIVAQVPQSRAETATVAVRGPDQDPFATPVALGIHTRKLMVAEVPVEDDGSFYVEVPTKVPLIVQGLNRHKMALHAMNRWFYLQPGEKLTFAIPRSIFPLRCAGCHGSLTGERVDGVGPPDLASASSRVMANWDPVASKSRAPYGGGSITLTAVDFVRDVQPILDAKCVSCHRGGGSAPDLDLSGTPTASYNVAYESLHRLREPGSGNFADKKYINEREALSGESSLIWTVSGLRGAPHPEESPLDGEELLTLIRWIDLGATFKGGK